MSSVIGEGTFGCVLKPSLTCSNKTVDYTGKVSKVMTTRDANDELKEFSKVNTIDTLENYHLGTPTICEIRDVEPNKDSIKKCGIGQEVLQNMDKYSLLVMKDGGGNLKDLATYFRVLNRSHVSQYELFLIESHRLIMAIRHFLQNNIIHNDLKPHNIVYNRVTNRANLIDFGLLSNKNDIIRESIDNTYYLSKLWWNYPIEQEYYMLVKYKNIFAKSNLDRGKIMMDLLKDDHIKTLFLFIIGPKDYKFKFLMACKNFYAYYFDFGKDTVEENHQAFLEKSLNTTDIYGLGISFMYVLNHSVNMINNKMYQQLFDIYYKMIHPNLHERYQIDELLRDYEEFLETSGILKKHKLVFEDHVLKPVTRSRAKTVKKMEVIDKQIKKIAKKPIKMDEKIKEIMDADITDVKKIKCGEQNKDLNPKTGRCVEKCKDGYVRDANFKCVSEKRRKSAAVAAAVAAAIKVVPPPQVNKCESQNKDLNPKTGRCVAKCKDGYVRDAKFKCVTLRKKLAAAAPPPPPTNKCQAQNKDLNPKTGRCVTKCKNGYVRDANFKCVSQRRKTLKKN